MNDYRKKFIEKLKSELLIKLKGYIYINPNQLRFRENDIDFNGYFELRYYKDENIKIYYSYENGNLTAPSFYLDEANKEVNIGVEVMSILKKKGFKNMVWSDISFVSCTDIVNYLSDYFPSLDLEYKDNILYIDNNKELYYAENKRKIRLIIPDKNVVKSYENININLYLIGCNLETTMGWNWGEITPEIKTKFIENCCNTILDNGKTIFDYYKTEEKSQIGKVIKMIEECNHEFLLEIPDHTIEIKILVNKENLRHRDIWLSSDDDDCIVPSPLETVNHNPLFNNAYIQVVISKEKLEKTPEIKWLKLSWGNYEKMISKELPELLKEIMNEKLK